jgi:hypothetical protein
MGGSFAASLQKVGDCTRVPARACSNSTQGHMKSSSTSQMESHNMTFIMLMRLKTKPDNNTLYKVNAPFLAH